MSDDLVQAFARLFAGRTDAYGTEQGGAERIAEGEEVPYYNHLHGGAPIGVYPLFLYQSCETDMGLAMDWRVHWGCVDMDVKRAGKHRWDYDTTEEAWDDAQSLRLVLESEGITGWIEVTRSHGYHVWVFTTESVSAQYMRRALLVACQIAGVPPTEVNPKSEGFDDPSQLGNYVRLPYPNVLAKGQSAEGTRTVLDADGGYLSLVNFVADAEESLARPEQLEELAKLWKPPAPAVEIGESDVDLSEITPNLNGLAWTILNNPPLEGQDRSSRLFKLACECKKSGVAPEEAVLVVRVADEWHGQKFVGRKDADDRYTQTVRKAWST